MRVTVCTPSVQLAYHSQQDTLLRQRVEVFFSNSPGQGTQCVYSGRPWDLSIMVAMGPALCGHYRQLVTMCTLHRMGPGVAAIIKRQLPSTVTTLNKFHCISILGGDKLVGQAYSLVPCVKTYPQLGLAILTVPGCKALRYIPVRGIVEKEMSSRMICKFADMQLSTCL